MRKTQKNLILMSMLFGIGFILSNIIGGKVIATGIYLFGGQITLPGGVLCYAITFLIMDCIGEIWGKETQISVMKTGLYMQVIALALILFTGIMPAMDEGISSAYNTLLGMNMWFVVGSLIAYFVSQNIDIYIFHKIKNQYMQAGGTTKARGLWNTGSTMVSQLVDTSIFVIIAFGIGLGWLFDKDMRSTLWMMIITKYLFNFALAALDTPFFYLLTREKGEKSVEFGKPLVSFNDSVDNASNALRQFGNAIQGSVQPLDDNVEDHVMPDAMIQAEAVKLNMTVEEYVQYKKTTAEIMAQGEANATFAETIRNLRYYAKLTRKELAEKADVAEATIRNYENGKYIPRLSQVAKIATALNVSIVPLANAARLKVVAHNYPNDDAFMQGEPNMQDESETEEQPNE